jgi:hypothetical protein
MSELGPTRFRSPAPKNARQMTGQFTASNDLALCEPIRCMSAERIPRRSGSTPGIRSAYSSIWLSEMSGS